MHPLLPRLVDPEEPCFGPWVVSDAEVVVGILTAAGYDFVGLDCQHGALAEADAARILRRSASSASPVIVRVSANSPDLIGRILDAGADGVMVPLVDNAEQARAAVAACRFPPDGIRSYGPLRADLPRSPGPLGDRAACFVMIETRDGVSQAGEIAAVPGIAGIVVGPADLAISYGAEPRAAFTSGVIDEPLAHVRRACETHEVKFGVFAGAGATVRRWTDRGARLVITGTDIGMLAAAAAADLGAARDRQTDTTASATARGPY